MSRFLSAHSDHRNSPVGAAALFSTPTDTKAADYSASRDIIFILRASRFLWKKMADSAPFLRSKCACWKTTSVTLSLWEATAGKIAYFGSEWKNTSCLSMYTCAHLGLEGRWGLGGREETKRMGLKCDEQSLRLLLGWQMRGYVTVRCSSVHVWGLYLSCKHERQYESRGLSVFSLHTPQGHWFSNLSAHWSYLGTYRQYWYLGITPEELMWLV